VNSLPSSPTQKTPRHPRPAPLALPTLQRRCSAIDELQDGAREAGLDLEVMQLHHGPLSGQMLLLEIPPLHLVRFQVRGRVHGQGQKPKGVFVVSVDLDPRPEEGPWRSHGLELPTDCLFGHGVNPEIHITLSPHTQVGMVSIPFGALRQWALELNWPGFDGELQPRRNVHLMHANSARRLRRYLRWLFAAAEHSPERLRRPATQRMLLGDLIPLLLEALITGPDVSRRTCRCPARIEIVKDVQQWIQAHPTTPVTLADLCREVHVSRRTLIQGFQDHLGMGPMAYVKLLRLHGLRRRFVAAGPNEIQIGAMAEAWGFHNAGHFAADYRRLFGESPRETLHRSTKRVS
jgi:AraC family ethanolamine operon transcriptional activator